MKRSNTAASKKMLPDWRLSSNSMVTSRPRQSAPMAGSGGRATPRVERTLSTLSIKARVSGCIPKIIQAQHLAQRLGAVFAVAERKMVKREMRHQPPGALAPAWKAQSRRWRGKTFQTSTAGEILKKLEIGMAAAELQLSGRLRLRHVVSTEATHSMGMDGF